MLQDYAGRGFLLRFILCTGDKHAFEQIDSGIRKAMEVGRFIQCFFQSLQ